MATALNDEQPDDVTSANERVLILSFWSNAMLRSVQWIILAVLLVEWLR